jgi:hypothetical protein
MAYIYDLTDTWNAAGTVFNGIKLNVTNSASASGSKLMTLQVGGTEYFGVSKEGDVRIGNGGDLRLSSATGTTGPTGDSSIYNDANDMIFATGTTTAERFRIGPVGQWGIAGANYGSAGQVLTSGGASAAPTWSTITINLANQADDYEEGSCTITIQDSAGNSATMGGSNVFRYVKVGAFVQVSGTLNWTSISALAAGSRIQFHGLPFPVNSVTNYRAPAIIGSSSGGSFNITRAEIAAGADAGNTFIFGTRVSGNNVDGDLVAANLGSSGIVYGFQINYTTTF